MLLAQAPGLAPDTVKVGTGEPWLSEKVSVAVVGAVPDVPLTERHTMHEAVWTTVKKA